MKQESKQELKQKSKQELKQQPKQKAKQGIKQQPKQESKQESKQVFMQESEQEEFRIHGSDSSCKGAESRCPNRAQVRIKLCGLRRPEDIQIVNEVMPEYAGFILAKGRRRTITPQRMAELSGELRPKIRKVAVFLDQDPEWICHLAGRGLMDLIQLHGTEDEDEIRFLQEKTGKPVIKAFRIETKEDVVKAQDSPADLVLLDHGAGGSGEAFDWALINSLTRPFFLAGGLTPENVSDAIARTRPMAVDVSSGVETESVKDAEKVRAFVARVRRGD